MHDNSRLLFSKYVKPRLSGTMRLLEIGPDALPSTFQQLADNDAITWDTLDICDNQMLTYPSSEEYEFNIPHNTYDAVLSGQVIEHVKKPWLWVKELARVTKKGGLVIVINPVSWHYHEAPVDCWRIYPEGMCSLYEDAKVTTEISVCKSMEMPNYKRYSPGVSFDFQSKKKQIITQVLGRFGFPVERSYDTLTIGVKN